MSFDRGGRGAGGGDGPAAEAPEPGKRTLAPGPTAAGGPTGAASRGVTGARDRLPYLEQVRRSFGRHDVSNIQVTIGGEAAAAAEELGAQAYAHGERIAFGSPPDLHTVAHEAAHVVQQRAGVTGLVGGMGKTGDRYEQQADAVAAAVVAGQSAEHLLDAQPSNAAAGDPVIQRKDSVDAAGFIEKDPTLFNEEVAKAITGIRMIERAPYGAHLQGSPFEQDVKSFIVGAATAGNLTDYYAAYVAPDDLTRMIDRARGHDIDTLYENNPREIRDAGPASKTYVRQVAVEVANAIARRYLQVISRYMDKLLERHVRAMVKQVIPGDFSFADPRDFARGAFPLELYDLSDMTTSHPVDVVVKQSLMNAQVAIPLEAIARTRDDLWKRFYQPVQFGPVALPEDSPETEPALRNVDISLKTTDGMAHWLEASTADGKPATAEEVALALFEHPPGDNDAATQFAHLLIPLAPLWGFPGHAVKRFQARHRLTLLTDAQSIQQQRLQMSVPEGEERSFPADIAAAFNLIDPAHTWTYDAGDPINELRNQRPGLVKQRAILAVSPEAVDQDELSVVARLTEALRIVEVIENRLTAIGAASFNLSAVWDDLNTRRQEAQTQNLMDPAAEWSLADQQATVLADIASGFSEISLRHALYVTKDDDGITQIEPAVQELLDDCRKPLEDALIALDFPDVAAQRAALGTQRASLLDVSLQEVSIHRGMPNIDKEIEGGDKTPEFDGAKAKDDSDQAAYDLGATRMLMMQQPGQGREELTQKSESIGILEFDISIGAKLASIDTLWKVVDDEEGFWEWQVDEWDGLQIKAENKQLRADFNTLIRTPWEDAKKANDKVTMGLVRTTFVAWLKGPFKKFCDKVQSFVQRAEKHKRWSKIIVGILIAVAAFALGQWEFAFLIDAGVGVAGSAVLAGVTTTLTSMALEKLILDHDPTLGSVIMGFAGNIAVFGIVGKMAMAARAAGVAAEVGEASVGAAAKTAEGTEAAVAAQKSGALAKALKGFAKELVFGEAFMLVAGEGQSLIDNHRLMTGPEMLETAAMGVVNIIGMKVAQYPFEAAAEIFKTFKGEKLAAQADIAGLMGMKQDLADLGNAVHAEAGGDGHLAKGRAPRARAQELLEKWREYQAKEKEVGEALLELAKKHPERFKMKGEELTAATEKLGNRLQEGAELNRQLRQAKAILAVEEIGPGIFRGDPAAMDVILAEHKASNSELLSVNTDPVTGQRTLRFLTADGMHIEMIEKLADPKARKPSKVPVGKARHFEQWLESIDTSSFEGAKKRARMTEYYARDPEAAMHLAETAYEYKGGEVETPELMPGADVKPAEPEVATAEPTGKDAKAGKTKKPAAGAKGPEAGTKPGVPAEPSAAQKAFEHYEYTRENKNTSDFSDQWDMKRSDFERWYEAGFEYDPIGERWVTRAGEPPPATRAGGAGPKSFDPADHKTSVLGEVHSEAVGHELMRMLTMGDANALRVVGVEAPAGFDPRTSEWGLGKQGDKIVLIKGGKGAVDWSMLPGVEDIAHSHPYFDAEGNPRSLKGHDGTGLLDLKRLQAGDAPAGVWLDLIHLLPSTGDLHFVAIKGAGGHRVHTPYVFYGEGKIGNPQEGGLHPTVEFTIQKSEAIGLLSKDSEIVVYKAELQVWAGDKMVGTLEIYERYHSSGSFAADWITMERPDGVVDLPANHKMSGAKTTPAGKGFEPRTIGNVSGDTLTSLVHQGLPPPPKGSPMEAALARLTPNQAQAVGAIAMSDRVAGFENWIDKIANDPTKMPRALHALEEARLALAEDATRQVTFDKDGKPRWEGDGKKAKIVEPETAAQTAAREMREASLLEDQSERTKNAFKKAGKEKAVVDLIDAAERGLGGGKNSTRYLELLETRPDIDIANYAKQAETFLNKAKVAPAQKQAIMERSLSPEVSDPVKFLEDAIWVADKTTVIEARANLLNSASTGMLDIAWLRGLEDLTGKELDTLGSRSYMAWNKAKIAAEYERMQQEKKAAGKDTTPRTKAEKAAQEEAGKANAAVNPQIRGVAGEVVAQNIELPGGFELERRGTPQVDGMEPDYVAKKGKVEADLEVKSNEPDKFKAQLREALDGSPDDSMQRMIRQLDGSQNRGRKAFLAVSDGLQANGGEKLLRQYLKREGLGKVEIVFMSEADILAAGRKLREHLGIRTAEQ